MIKHLKLIKKIIKQKLTLKNLGKSILFRVKIVVLVYGIGIFIGIPMLWYIEFVIRTRKTSLILFLNELQQLFIFWNEEWKKDFGNSLILKVYDRYDEEFALIPVIGTSCLVVLWLYLLNKLWKQYWVLYDEEYGGEN